MGGISFLERYCVKRELWEALLKIGVSIFSCLFHEKCCKKEQDLREGQDNSDSRITFFLNFLNHKLFQQYGVWNDEIG